MQRVEVALRLLLLLIGVMLFVVSICNAKGSSSQTEEKGGRNSPGALSRFSPGGQYVMLTFSGGPHFKNTPLLLNILKDKRARATFFMSGAKAQHRPRMLRRMAAEGHELACEGYYPSSQFPKLKSQEQVVHHVQRAVQVLTNITNIKVEQVRPPSGVTSAAINENIKQTLGVRVILWSLDSLDLSAHVTVESITSRVLGNVQPGDVVLFHDSQNITVKALPIILDGLYNQGYEMLTIAQVLSFPDDSPH